MVLSAAVTVVGLLGLLNLLLTLGLVRRLRELEAGPAATPPRAGGLVVSAGAAVETHATVDVAGRPVLLPDPDASTVVGFFATDCPSCADSIPAFLARAGRDRTVAVVTGPRDDDDAYVRRLAPAGRVVADGDADGLVGAFQVRAYPAFVRLDPDGTVRASGHSLGDVPDTVTA